jgi:hypothetical protein
MAVVPARALPVSVGVTIYPAFPKFGRDSCLRAISGWDYFPPSVCKHFGYSPDQAKKTKGFSMKTKTLFSIMPFLAWALITTASPKDDVTSAAKQLGEKANYSWKTTVTVPEGSRYRPGPTEGQIEKDGFTHLSMSFRDNKAQAFLKGDKGAVTNPDGGWQSLADVENAEGGARFIGRMLRTFKPPAVHAAELAAGAKDLKQEGDTWSGDLTEDMAKELLSFRGRGGGDAPTVTNPKGSVKFWVKDGLLTKYEFKVEGKVSFNGNDRDIDRTTTVEIKDVGTTKIDVPAEAKEKMS